MKSILGQGERSQVPQHRPISKGNQGVGIITYSYCQHVGQLFNHCPIIDDILRQFLREEVMNVHQPVLPITTTVVPNVLVLRTQAMNPNINHIYNSIC